MQNELNVQDQRSNDKSSLNPFKRLFRNKPRNKNRRTRFGRSAGVIWQYGEGETACAVQIDLSDDFALVTVYDSEDLVGTSVTNCFEYIATGVYLEHLSDSYLPNQVKFKHRTTLEGDAFYRWGVMNVSMEWNAKEGVFQNLKWGQWIADLDTPESDLNFLQMLACRAKCGAETYMRELDENGNVTPRMKEIYNEYQGRISISSESKRFNLRFPVI
jgi:hypothetical protein